VCVGGGGSGALRVIGSLELPINPINKNLDQKAVAGSSGAKGTVDEGSEEVASRNRVAGQKTQLDGINGNQCSCN